MIYNHLKIILFYQNIETIRDIIVHIQPFSVWGTERYRDLG